MIKMSVPKFPSSSSRSVAFTGVDNPLFQKRVMSSLSMDLLDIIKSVTLDQRMPPNLVGSFKYIVHEYPADIDMFEAYVYDGAGGITGAGKDIAAKLAVIAQNIKARKDIYLGDFKAGVDERYQVDIGHINSESGKLAGYKPAQIRERIQKIQEAGLLTADEADTWFRAVIDQPSILEYMDLEATIRKKYVVRWSLDELTNQEKNLPYGAILRLEKAVTQKSIVKIDIWARLQKRFIEVTNFYDLRYKNKQDTIISMNLENSGGAKSYELSLLADLHHYSNPDLGKFMKLSKRLWLYAVLKKDKNLLHALYPLFGSGAAKMYQIMGEVETIENIMEKVKRPAMKDILENIEDWKARLGTVTNDILPGHIAYELFKRINAALTSKKKEDIMKTLDYVGEKLNFYINSYVVQYLKKSHVNVKKYTTTQ